MEPIGVAVLILIFVLVTIIVGYTWWGVTRATTFRIIEIDGLYYPQQKVAGTWRHLSLHPEGKMLEYQPTKGYSSYYDARDVIQEVCRTKTQDRYDPVVAEFNAGGKKLR